MKFSFPRVTLIAAVFANTVQGMAPYGICQSGCAAVVVPCYSAAGFVFGTVAAPAAPATILACNSGFGACSAKCAGLFLAAPAAAAKWGFPLLAKYWGAEFIARQFWHFKENFSKYSGFWDGTAQNPGQGMCAWSERSFDERSFD
ncbi:hypothetical protein JCM5353_000730 [Sporobolomyces roseus]